MSSFFHFRIKHVQRGKGRNAVAAAAYRAGDKLHFEREGKLFDYSRRRGVVHEEIVVPDGVDVVEWGGMDREKLWNLAENTEKRKDACTAIEFEIALCHEMSDDENLDLMREFCGKVANETGAVVDFAIHAPVDKEGDSAKNVHAHVLIQTRKAGKSGLGDKIVFCKSDKWLKEHKHSSRSEQSDYWREACAQMMNYHLAKAGLDVRVDHRSHAKRGLSIKPTKHVGVHATAMERKGIEIFRKRISEEDKQHNKTIIQKTPSELLKIITSEKSVFDKRDIARCIHRYTELVGEDFQALFAKVLSADEMVELRPEAVNAAGSKIPAKYSTNEMLDIEMNMVISANLLNCKEHALPVSCVEKAIGKLNEGLKSAGGSLSKQQRQAIRHLTGSSRIAALVGYAGAGKSTVLAAAREAWELKGYRVMGVALAGKASDGLEKSSGIKSRTLASLEYSLQHGYEKLSKNDVLVVDEAGMCDSRQLERLISKAEVSGAKIVLVGDPNQLQPIGAGAGFRAVANEIGCANLTGILRQTQDWQKEASSLLATGQVKLALQCYDKFNSIRFAPAKIHQIKELTLDYQRDMESNPNQTRLALAHRREDCKLLNASIRTALQIAGRLAYPASEGETMWQTDDGVKALSNGDRLVFLQNNSKLGVKNGMLATVDKIHRDGLTVTLDDGRSIAVPKTYRTLDYGYATTIHKSQGATVDRTFVLASKTLDRQLSYVALSRHREGTTLYANKQDFLNEKELSSKLSRDRSKETTLDYLHSFNTFRGFNSPLLLGSEMKRKPEASKHRQKKLDRVLDYFCHAAEERMWWELHDVVFIGQKFGKSLNMAEETKPGLRDVLLGVMYGVSGTVRQLILKLSGQERVDAVKTQIDEYEQKQHLEQEQYQRPRRKNKRKTAPERPSPSPSPRF